LNCRGVLWQLHKEDLDLENKQTSKTISLSDKAIKECYINIRSQLIKLLYMIENEQKGEGSAEL